MTQEKLAQERANDDQFRNEVASPEWWAEFDREVAEFSEFYKDLINGKAFKVHHYPNTNPERD